MKNLFIYLFTIILFCSCEHHYCGIYIIQNNTNKNLILHLNNEIIELDKTYVLQNEKCDLGSIPALDLYEYDSIYITDIYNVILTTYKPFTYEEIENRNCTKKNIYNYFSCWLKKEESKYNYIYTYEITNEDLGLVDEHID